MKSSFVYGNSVSGNNFCLRKEQKQIEDLLNKGKSVYLVSRKNMGKTSLILNLNLSSKIIYVDCKKDNLVQNIAEAVLSAYLESDVNKDYAKYFLKYQHLNPTMTMNEGKVVFKIDAKDKELEDLESIMGGVENVNFILFFDNLEYLALKHKKQSEEFLKFVKNKQCIACESIDYNEKLYFSNKTGFQQVVLKPLDSNLYFDFCVKKMNEKNNVLSKEFFEFALNSIGENSFYRQRFFAYIFNNYEGQKLEKSDYNKIVNRLIKEDEESFEIITNSLTENQLKVLKLLAKDLDIKIYSTKTMEEYGFQSANAVSKMVQSLLSKNILYKKESNYEFFSPLFKSWISQN